MYKRFTLALSALFSVAAAMAQSTPVTSLDQTAGKAFTISTQDRGSWMVQDGANAANSTQKLGVAVDKTSKNQQFAFVKLGDAYYLWSVSAKKFVMKDGQVNKLADEPIEKVELLASTGANKANFPTVIKIGEWQFAISPGWSPAVISHWNQLDDPGNMCAIEEAAPFDQNAEVGTLLNVTYKLVDAGGKEIASSTAWQKTDVPAMPASMANSLYTYEYDTEKITTTPATVTVKAVWNGPFQLSENYANAKWYYLTLRGNKYVTYSSTATPYPATTTNPETRSAAWAFVSDAYGKVKLLNMGAGEGKFLSATDQRDGGAPTMTEEATNWIITPNGDGFSLKADVAEANLYPNDYAQRSIMAYWKDGAAANDGGSKFNVQEAPAVLPNSVVYNVMFEGKKVGSVEAKANVGSVAELPGADSNEYAFFSYSPSKIGEDTKEVTVDAYWNGPVKLSESYDKATWYFLTIRQNNPKYIVAGTEPIALKKDNNLADGVFWAFVGDPYNGIKLMNRAAGEGKYLEATNQSNGGAPKFTTTHTQWIVTPNAGGFSLHVGSNLYLNDFASNSQLKYWADNAGATDDGSCIVATEVPENFNTFVEENLGTWFDNYDKDGYFGLSEIAYTNLLGKYEAAKTYCSNTDYNELRAAIEKGLRLPGSGFYAVKNAKYGEYLGFKSKAVALAGKSAATAVFMESSGDKVAFKVNGGYLQAAGQSAQVQVGETPVWFTPEVVSPGVVGFHTDGGYTFIHCDQQRNIVGWESGKTSEPSAWTVEPIGDIEVPLSEMGEGTYAAFQAPFNFRLGEGAKAAVVSDVKDVDGNAVATLVDIDGAVPAETPVILYSVQGDATATLTPSYGYVPEIGTPNLLRGVNAQQAQHYAMLLGAGENGPEFAPADGDIAANTAFLPSSAADGKDVVFLHAATTGIAKAVAAQAAGGVYDIQGRKVQGFSKPGLYIVGGKKVVVK